MIPFDLYPGRGRELLKYPPYDNCRLGYFPYFMQKLGQEDWDCPYCGLKLTDNYKIWLGIAIDHVIPVSACKAMRLPNEWTWDFANTILACTACNGFCNRFTLPASETPPSTLEEFFDLRDRVFRKRKSLLEDRHNEERKFFESRSWEPIGSSDIL